MPAQSVPASSGLGKAREARTPPRQRTLIRWVFIARGIVALGALLAAALAWTRTPDVSFILTIAVLVALVVTVYGAWRVYLQGGEASRGFLFGQALVDVGLVATIVHYSYTPAIFASLFVIVLAAYAVLLPLGWATVVALLAVGGYVADMLVTGRPGLDTAFWVQVLLFSVVFVVVSVLGGYLRRADAEQFTLEHELRRVRLEADDILRNIRSGVITVSGDGRLAFINPTGERLLGLDAGHFMARPVLDALAARSAELREAIVSGIQEGRRVSRGEGNVKLGGATPFPIGLSTTVFRQDGQGPPSVTAIFTDISDLKQLQELHLRAERLEAVAALSASLAHEIKNPLASIRSSCEQLARGRQATDDDKVLAGLVVRESDRLSRLLSEFLDFSRVRVRKQQPVDLRVVAEAAVSMVRAHPDCGPGKTLAVEGESLIVEADEDLLHRVMANLVLNAVQAAPEPVRVVVRVEPLSGAAIPAASGFERAARIQVRDNGPGIPEEIRSRLFQPFVSGRKGGTGLGLAIVQRAVEAHRGLVFVESARGAGTTFSILLPATMLAEELA